MFEMAQEQSPKESGKLKANPHKIPTVVAPTVTAINTPGSTDYIRLRGLREPGYYIIQDS